MALNKLVKVRMTAEELDFVKNMINTFKAKSTSDLVRKILSEFHSSDYIIFLIDIKKKLEKLRNEKRHNVKI